MDLDTFVAWSQILGVLGGLIALVFVGLQIRDNSRAVLAATAQAVHETYSSWYNSLLDSSDALKASTKALTEPDKLTPVEKMLFICTFMSFLSNSQNAFHQWREGHLSDELWGGWDALIMNLINTPGGAAFWGERCYLFGRQFQDHIAVVMAREPDPCAKAFGVVPAAHVAE